MKKFKSVGMLLCFAITLFLISCGGEGTKGDSDADTTTADASSTTTETAAPVNTIITTPQGMMTARHKVADYAKWKLSYEAHDSMRLANSIHNYVIGRGVQDSNMVLVAVKVDDMAKAKAFAKDPSLKQAMQKGGVKGTPIFAYTTMVFQDTANVGAVPRSMTTFTVKDWAAWEQKFLEGKQTRLDNGITVRAYGHDPDDNKKVVVVTALLDTAKANAYWKSDAFKERIAASGVIGQPERFLFNVVQRY
jgi:hypothetical protein